MKPEFGKEQVQVTYHEGLERPFHLQKTMQQIDITRWENKFA
jgi:hypothetical protein